MTEQVLGTQDVSSASRLQQAYQKHFEKLSAQKEHELTTINLDVPSVYTLGTGALMKVRAYREQMLALPHVNTALIEEIEEYLLALGHAQALYLAASAPVASIPELYEQLLRLCEVLLADAPALVTRALIPSDRLKELRGPVSHAATAFDVMALTSILRAHWDKIQGKTAVALSELERAEILADRLLTAVGERTVEGGQAASSTRARQGAFTLFVKAYDEVRRGLVYLRWHDGDADEIAPSLYSSRVGRRRKPDSREQLETAPVTPAAATQGRLEIGASALGDVVLERAHDWHGDSHRAR